MNPSIPDPTGIEAYLEAVNHFEDTTSRLKRYKVRLAGEPLDPNSLVQGVGGAVPFDPQPTVPITVEQVRLLNTERERADADMERGWNGIPQEHREGIESPNVHRDRNRID